MRVLVLGGGAREHAMVWKLSADRTADAVVCAPGNAGIAALARCVPVPLDDPHAILALADAERIDITVVGPEMPLTVGVADLFAAHHRALLGPTRAAAALESSKAFAKDFMARHNVPTARYRVCDSAADAFEATSRGELGFPVVVKADGLAAGKGVVVAPDRPTADQAIRAAMVDRQFGDAGARVVLEECLQGREASFFVISDGEQGVPFFTAEDHKRIFDEDRGPNTGGMGAFAPSPLVGPAQADQIMDKIVRPVLDGLRQEGRRYRGFLYVGLMLTRDGPKVIEFNVRLGDPEAQVILPMLDEPMLPLIADAASGSLNRSTCRFSGHRCVGVVMASGGYPGEFVAGQTISGVEAAEAIPDVLVFHAGTTRREGRLVTSGGRVLTVVGQGSDYEHAAATAYRGVNQIAFAGSHYRTDIGAKAVGTGHV
jgi:phosphoribosylamine--glycine ligase